MCSRRRRWLLALFCFCVWLTAFALLWCAVPIQPRLRLESMDNMVLVGITSDSRKLITAGLVNNPNDGVSGPARSWDLWNGCRETFDLADVRPWSAFPGGHRDPDWWKSYIIWRTQIAPCGNILAYDYRKQDTTDPSLRLLDLTRGREVLCLPGGMLDSANFSADGKWLAVMHGCADARHRSVRVFATATGQEVILNDPAHPSEEVVAFSFSPDGQFLAVTAKIDDAWHTHVWEIATTRKLGMIPGWNYYVALGPGADMLAVVQEHGIVKLFDVAAGRLRFEMKDHVDMFSALTFAPDGRTLTAYYDWLVNGRSLHRATTWDASSGRLLNRFDAPVTGFICVDPNWRRHAPAQLPVADSSPRIFVQYDRDDWKVFDVITGKHLGSWPRTHDPVRVSPDNTTLVTHVKIEPRPNAIWRWIKEHVFRTPTKPKEDREETSLELWDLATRRSLDVLDDYATECLFSPDGKTFVAQKDSKRIDVWDLPPRKPIGSIIAWSVMPALLVLLFSEARRRRLQRKVVAAESAPVE
jgi:WD40 repeat protein